VQGSELSSSEESEKLPELKDGIGCSWAAVAGIVMASGDENCPEDSVTMVSLTLGYIDSYAWMGSEDSLLKILVR
jgi:hypothetical protein